MPSLAFSDMATIAVFAALAVWLLFFRKRTPPMSSREFQELMSRGAQILDVRTSGEFSQGHAKGSKNIPLGDLHVRLGELNRDKPILACCASGMRSARAVAILRKAGFTEVHNVGSWNSLKN